MAEVVPDICEIPLRCYSVKSFADITDVSESTVKREIDDKLLKAKKRGRRTIITHEDAMAFLASLRPVDAQLTLDDTADGADQAEGK